MDLFIKRDDFDYGILNFPVLDGVVSRTTSYGVNISQRICFARMSSDSTNFNARCKSLTAQILQQGYRYHKLGKAILNFIVDLQASRTAN